MDALGQCVVLRITGRVASPREFSLDELRSMNMEEMEDIPVICGTGNPKGKIGKIRGVMLDEVIGKAEVLKINHDDTKKMYLVAASDDGYRVVYSWQEIFNSPMGAGVVVVLERDGEVFDGSASRIELISTSDYFTGARYVKGLCEIDIRMA